MASAARTVTSRFKIVVPAGKASPQPPVGSALGQRGLKLMDFCKAFNDQTSHIKEGTPIPVKVTAYGDRSFTFDWFYPSASYFLKAAAGVDKGAHRPGQETVGRVTVQQIYEIAALKIKDFDKKHKKIDLRMMARALVGSCRSMGLQVYCPAGSTPGVPDFLPTGAAAGHASGGEKTGSSSG